MSEPTKSFDTHSRTGKFLIRQSMEGLMKRKSYATLDELSDAVEEDLRDDGIDIEDTDRDRIRNVVEQEGDTGTFALDDIVRRKLGKRFGVLVSIAVAVVGFLLYTVIASVIEYYVQRGIEEPPAPASLDLANANPPPAAGRSTAVSAVFQVPPEIRELTLPFTATVTNALGASALQDLTVLASAGRDTSTQSVSAEYSIAEIAPNSHSVVEGSLDTSNIDGEHIIFKAYILGPGVTFKTPPITVARGSSERQQTEQRTSRERELERIVAMRKEQLGELHPQYADALRDLAHLLASGERHDEAEALFKQVVDVREASPAPVPAAIATALYDLAGSHVSQLRYTEAEPLYRRMLAVAEQALGPEHPELAPFLSDLGTLYLTLGRYGDAEPLYERALAIREQALGPEHLDVAMSLYDVALLQVSRGAYAKAEADLEKVLTIAEGELGPQHVQLAWFLDDLAGIYQSQGRASEAQPLLERALALRQKALGANHPDVALSLYNLAGFFEGQNRPAEAKPLIARADAISGYYELEAVDPDEEVVRLIETVRMRSEDDPERQVALGLLKVFAQVGQVEAVKYMEAFN